MHTVLERNKTMFLILLCQGSMSALSLGIAWEKGKQFMMSKKTSPTAIDSRTDYVSPVKYSWTLQTAIHARSGKPALAEQVAL